MNCGKNNGIQMTTVYRYTSNTFFAHLKPTNKITTTTIKPILTTTKTGFNIFTEFNLASNNTNNNNGNSNTIPEYNEDYDLEIIEITVIMLLIMFCGVIYACWRFILHRQDKRREIEYMTNMSSGNDLLLDSKRDTL